MQQKNSMWQQKNVRTIHHKESCIKSFLTQVEPHQLRKQITQETTFLEHVPRVLTLTCPAAL